MVRTKCTTNFGCKLSVQNNLYELSVNTKPTASTNTNNVIPSFSSTGRSSHSPSRHGWCVLLHTPSNSFIHFLLAHSIIRCSQPAVSISAPALLDSSLQPGQPSVDASTSPAASPKPQGETQQYNGVPARLTGRHFLGKRETDSDCKVCSQHKRKPAEEEEQEKKKKKQKMVEGDESERKTEEEEAEGVNSHGENDGERKEEEQKSVPLRRQTLYYCKTCSGEPSLCPVPCFELYHTRLIYKTAPELETQGEPSESHNTINSVIL